MVESSSRGGGLRAIAGRAHTSQGAAGAHAGVGRAHTPGMRLGMRLAHAGDADAGDAAGAHAG
eukprot:5931333-Prymnesium_polylepis.1